MSGVAAGSSVLPDKLEYWTALGRFIDLFSHVEFDVFVSLVFVSGVNSTVGNELFGKVGVGSAVDKVKKVSKINGKSLDRITISALNQLRVIAELRNDLLHNGCGGEGAVKYTMSWWKKGVVNRKAPISIDILNQMSWDLERIRFCIAPIILGVGRTVKDVWPDFAQSESPQWKFKPGKI